MKNRIGELRREKGLTLKEMGSLLNIRDNTLSQYETGKREPQLVLMMEIANFFEVSLEYLFNGTDIRDRLINNLERGAHFMEQVDKSLEKGYLVYLKNGKIETVEPPSFGYVTVVYQDGQAIMIEKNEKKKV